MRGKYAAMPLATLPNDCRALIVEPEPVHAMALDLLLGEFGCRRTGIAASHTQVEKYLKHRQPSFALIDASLGDELQPIAECLDHKEVPFGILTFGARSTLLGHSKALRDRPKIDRPFHAPTLHATASVLYRQWLHAAIANSDRHIAQGQQRLANQLKLIERLAGRGADTTLADGLAREYGRTLQAMRTTRRILAKQLDSFAEDFPLPQGWGTGSAYASKEQTGRQS